MTGRGSERHVAAPTQPPGDVLENRATGHVGLSGGNPGDPLDAVYEWLVEDVHFPFDITFGSKPAWLDLRRLAAAYHRSEPDESVDDWYWAIREETGWTL